jgi:hypothetical protein
VSDITGALTATTRFGSIRAERVRGAAVVDNQNGTVTLKEIGNAATVRSSFGSVFVDGVGGAVKVDNSNGAIAVAGLRGKGCHPVALRTNFSTIKVSVPESSSYSVNARTSFGSIKSALPVTTNGVTENTLVGTIGRGGCQLDLTNANGNISIEKE